MKIETIISPALFHQVSDLESKIVVVIDILRATSTITTILSNGALSVIPVKEEREAREYQSQGYLVGGERGGETIVGFDFGNSPFHYEAEKVANKDVVLTTTNGTKCIEMAANCHELIIGSFLNISAIANHLLKAEKDVVLFCAGWKDKVNLEDSLFAGAVANKLSSVEMDDASRLVKTAWEAIDDLLETLKKSAHYKRLASKGVEKDIAFCCQEDTFSIVPKLDGKKLVID